MVPAGLLQSVSSVHVECFHLHLKPLAVDECPLD